MIAEKMVKLTLKSIAFVTSLWVTFYLGIHVFTHILAYEKHCHANFTKFISRSRETCEISTSFPYISLRGTFNNKIESKATKNFSILPHTFQEKIKIVMREYLLGFFLNIIESHVLKGFLGKLCLFYILGRTLWNREYLWQRNPDWKMNYLDAFCCCSKKPESKTQMNVCWCFIRLCNSDLFRDFLEFERITTLLILDALIEFRKGL